MADHLQRFLDSLAAWDAWVAIGTLALAAATVYLGRETRKVSDSADAELAAARDQAEASRESADAAREAVSATLRPLITDVPPGSIKSDLPVSTRPGVSLVERSAHARVEFPIRNVGQGIALIQGVTIRVSADEAPPEIGSAYSTIVVPGEITWCWADVDLADLLVERRRLRLRDDQAEMIVDVDYCDANGRQRQQTRFHLRHENPETSVWPIHSIEFFSTEPHERNPAVTTITPGRLPPT